MRAPSFLALPLLAAAALAPTTSFADEPSPLAEVGDGYTPLQLPRGAMPTRFEGEAVRLPLASCNLTYHGGPVITQPQIVVVYWGSVTSQVQQLAPGLVTAVVQSAYLDQLSEYNTQTQKIVRGSFGKAFPITPTKATGTQIDDTQIGPELTAQIQAKNLPAPTYDAAGHVNTLYLTFFAPGISITQQGAGSCVQGGFCGYHNSTTYNGKTLPYAVIPDMGAGSGCDQGCGGSLSAAVGITVSHEIAEAVTDVDVGANDIAWYDDTCNGEIADLCSPGGSGTGAGSGSLGGFTMSYEWSNSKKTCELTNAAIGPQGGCAKNADCAAPTPVCNTTKQTCVGCLQNSDCSGATPACDTTSNTCRACAADSDCSGATPACVTAASDPNKGKCVQCATSAQCNATAPVCAAGACTGCRSDADCTDGRNPTCNTSSGACVSASGVTVGSSGGGTDGSGGSGGATGGNGDTSGGSGDGANSSAHRASLPSEQGGAGCAVGATGSGSGDAFALVGLAFALAAAARGRRKS